MTHPRYLLLHKQTTLHKPCRISAIGKTTSLRCSYHRYPPDEAIAFAYLKSSATTNPVTRENRASDEEQSDKRGNEFTHFAGFSVVLSADPPLLLNFQCFLEVKEEVRTRHGSSGEKVRAHPTLFKIIGCCSVCKDVYEEFSSWPQRFGDFVH